MTYDHELILVGVTTYTKDDVGNQIPTAVEKTILCCKKSIGRNEFYSAAVAGLKPEITFLVHGYEYSGEDEVKFEGSKYKVIRTYSTDFEELELVCERVITSGN